MYNAVSNLLLSFTSLAVFSNDRRYVLFFTDVSLGSTTR